MAWPRPVERPHSPATLPFRSLYFHHVSAETSQELGTVRAGDAVGEVKNVYALKRAGHERQVPPGLRTWPFDFRLNQEFQDYKDEQDWSYAIGVDALTLTLPRGRGNNRKALGIRTWQMTFERMQNARGIPMASSPSLPNVPSNFPPGEWR